MMENPTKKEIELINQIEDLKKQLSDAGKQPTFKDKYVYVGMYPYEREALRHLVHMATVDTGTRATYGSVMTWAEHICQAYLDEKQKAKE